jgi:hypothetical protein
MEHYKKQLDFVNIEFWAKIQKVLMQNLKSDEYRLQKCPPYIQCDSCLKWRELTYHPEQLDTNFPPSLWECKINWDSNFDRLA